jgi:hypothetical protein
MIERLVTNFLKDETAIGDSAYRPRCHHHRIVE